MNLNPLTSTQVTPLQTLSPPPPLHSISPPLRLILPQLCFVTQVLFYDGT